MWYSIQKFHQPNSLKQAIELHKSSEKVFMAGGSYLVSEQNKAIQEIIWISHLLEKKIVISQNAITISAGTTIQEIVENCVPLSKFAKDSCFSKNIRNQRTIGGELAQKNLQSDLYVSLVALNPKIHIFRDEEETILLQSWDGKGIITSIDIDLDKANKMQFFRYALLPSANAFVLVAIVPDSLGWHCILGGKVSHIQNILLTQEMLQVTDTIATQLVSACTDDPYGTVAYKQYLVKLSLDSIQK